MADSVEKWYLDPGSDRNWGVAANYNFISNVTVISNLSSLYPWYFLHKTCLNIVIIFFPSLKKKQQQTIKRKEINGRSFSRWVKCSIPLPFVL